MARAPWILLALLVLTLSAWPVGAPSGGTLAGTGSTAAGSPDVASLELGAAANSLAHGAGPAAGTPVSCSSALLGAAVSCAAPTTSPTTLGWSPVGAPEGRDAVSMVYDAADGYVVLFGNGVDSNVLGDTWIFQQGQWTELDLPVAPAPRVGAYMAYDSEASYVLLFGGWGGYNGPGEYGDTWAFSGGTWRLLIPESACTPITCPSPRDSGVMADDPADGYVVLFGGYGGLNDTWTFSDGSWTIQVPQSSCTASSCPAAGDSGAFAWDPALREDVLFGGFAGTADDNATWAFSGGSWHEVIAPSACTGPHGGNPCPSPREGADLAWDSTSDALVLFGGYNSSTYASYNDVWTFGAGGWTKESAASGCSLCPSARDSAGMADDPADGGLLLFGGYANHGDLWLYAGGSWSPYSYANAPATRWDASMSWDPALDEVVLFGGWSYTGISLQDTWSYADGVWTEVLPASRCTDSTCPSARLGAAFGWDGLTSSLVLFGGMTSLTTGYLQDTWSYTSAGWTELLGYSGDACTSSTCPSARANASVAWDSLDASFVLFGGVSTGPTYENDTWDFSGGTWHEVLDAADCADHPCPSPRESAAMVPGPAPTGGVVLFGGASGPSTFLNDTWLYLDGSWTEVDSTTYCASQACPTPRSGAGMSYDPGLGVIVLFGGEGSRGGDDDTWEYAQGTWTKESFSGLYPSYDAYPAFAWDGTTGNLLLFAGDISGYPDATWELGPALTVGTPVASASPADVGQTVSFSASVSGGGTGTTSVTWQGLPPGCPSAPTTWTVACTLSAAGTFYLTDVVTTSSGLAGQTSNFLGFTVSTAPQVQVLANASSLALGSTLNLTAAEVGGSLPLASYFWQGLPPSCGPGPTAAVRCALAASQDIGTWPVEVSVTDAAGDNVTSAVLSVSVTGAPWSALLTASTAALDVGQSVLLTASAPGGPTSVSWTWTGLPTGCSATGAQFSCAPTAPGSYTLQAQGTSNESVTAVTEPLTLEVYAALGTPTLSLSAASLTLGAPLEVAASVSGGDSPYGYAWSGLPAGCVGADQPALSCTPSATGSFSVGVSVTDAAGVTHAATAAGLAVAAAALGNVALSASTTALDLGQSVSLYATTTGSGTPGLAWTGLPQGCTETGSTATCTPLATGTYVVEVQGGWSDGYTATSNPLAFTVYPALRTPVVLASGSDIALGSEVSFGAEIGGGYGPWSYAWSGLPAGCTGGNVSGFSCTPALVGSYSITVTVSDAGGGAATSAPVTLTVASVAAAPAASNSSYAAGANGLEWTLLALGLIVVVLAALMLVLLLLGRRPRSPPAPPYVPPPRPAPPAPTTPAPQPAQAPPMGPAPPRAAGLDPPALPQARARTVTWVPVRVTNVEARPDGAGAPAR